MQKRKMKLNKKNIALALVTSVALISGAKAVYHKISNNNSSFLTAEETGQREILLKDDEIKKEEKSYAGIGYTTEGLIIITALSSSVFLYKNDSEKNQRIYNNAIESEIKRKIK